MFWSLFIHHRKHQNIKIQKRWDGGKYSCKSYTEMFPLCVWKINKWFFDVPCNGLILGVCLTHVQNEKIYFKILRQGFVCVCLAMFVPYQVYIMHLTLPKLLHFSVCASLVGWNFISWFSLFFLSCRMRLTVLII